MTDLITENARLRAALEAAKRDTALALAQVDRLLTLTTTLATERDDSREYAVALEAELKARAALAVPAPDAVQEAARDTDLLLDAYKGLLVLHRLFDKIGLQAGAKTTSDLADRIVAAHPEFPGRAALRAIAGGRT